MLSHQYCFDFSAFKLAEAGEGGILWGVQPLRMSPSNLWSICDMWGIMFCESMDSCMDIFQIMLWISQKVLVEKTNVDLIMIMSFAL